MSTDYNVVNHTKKTWWHLGQMMATTYSFGFGSLDLKGRSVVALLIDENLGDDLRIVETDSIPDDYAEIEITNEDVIERLGILNNQGDRYC